MFTKTAQEFLDKEAAGKTYGPAFNNFARIMSSKGSAGSRRVVPNKLNIADDPLKKLKADALQQAKKSTRGFTTNTVPPGAPPGGGQYKPPVSKFSMTPKKWGMAGLGALGIYGLYKTMRNSAEQTTEPQPSVV